MWLGRMFFKSLKFLKFTVIGLIFWNGFDCSVISILLSVILLFMSVSHSNTIYQLVPIRYIDTVKKKKKNHDFFCHLVLHWRAAGGICFDYLFIF